MPDPRFVPRDLLVDGKGFGLSSRPNWVRPGASDTVRRDRVAVAKLQHEWVVRLRRALAARRLDFVDYAPRAGTSVDRLERIARGTVLLRLEDVAAAMRVLDLGLTDVD